MAPSQPLLLLLLLPLATMLLLACHQQAAAAAAADPDDPVVSSHGELVAGVLNPASDLKNPFELQATTNTTRARSLLQAPRLDCPKVCSGRCGNNWKNEMCNKMCNVCCNRCNCVPPGTGQDTRHICPCYDQMTNPHTGKLKCP